LDWGALQVKSLLHVLLVFVQGLPDVVVKVQADIVLQLLNLHTKKCLYEPFGIFRKEFLLELVTRRDIHHVVHKQAMNNEIVTVPGKLVSLNHS
jgi:hypothetical protein